MLYEDILTNFNSHIRRFGHIDTYTGSRKQTMPTRILRPLQFHTNKHSNLLDYSGHLLLVRQ